MKKYIIILVSSLSLTVITLYVLAVRSSMSFESEHGVRDPFSPLDQIVEYIKSGIPIGAIAICLGYFALISLVYYLYHKNFKCKKVADTN